TINILLDCYDQYYRPNEPNAYNHGVHLTAFALMYKQTLPENLLLGGRRRRTLRFIILDNLYVRYSFNTFHVLNPLVSFDVEAMLTEV
ncbi:hypothetical protein BLOT_004689, partial [Blomia tropicalis]